MRYTILAMEDQPDDRVKVTIDTRTFGRANVVIPRASLADHGTIEMLDRLWDQEENIRTLVRRSGKQRKL